MKLSRAAAAATLVTVGVGCGGGGDEVTVSGGCLEAMEAVGRAQVPLEYALATRCEPAEVEWFWMQSYWEALPEIAPPAFCDDPELFADLVGRLYTEATFDVVAPERFLASECK